MNNYNIGSRVKRKEDEKLVSGLGNYIDDINFHNQCYVYILRSPHANAKIISIDKEEALKSIGVISISTGIDTESIKELPCVVDKMFEFKKRDGSKRFFPKHNVLALEFVRHVGDPVAMVAAKSYIQAKDAAELIYVDYEILPCAIDTASACEEKSHVIYSDEGATDNQAFVFSQGNQDKILEIFQKADHLVNFKHTNQRIVCNSMEPRGCIGIYDEQKSSYTLYTNTQSVYRNRQVCAEQLGIDEKQLHVICPDVGGSFGMKGMPYPEQPLVLWLSKKLNIPVKWYADRSESFISDTQGRDLVTDATLALDSEGKFLGLKVLSIGNMGAYASNFGPMILSLGSTKLLPGCYDIANVYAEVEVVITNKVFTDAYRGAGRPEASYVIERLVDLAADKLGIDPIEIRLKNLITEEQMPYTGPTDLVYDSGNFAKNLKDCLTKADWESFKNRKKLSEANGKLRGIGISVYIEATAGSVPETSRIQILHDGTTNVYTGSLAQGQGHETTFAQIASQKLGIDYNKINVIQGDSETLSNGGGTGGSRSVYSGGGAILASADKIISKSQKIAANHFEVSDIDIDFLDGEFIVKGTDKKINITKIAKLAQNQEHIPNNFELGLDETESYTSDGSTFPNGCHIVEIEVDPETGFAKIDQYTVVDDFGVVINPLVVEGQVHGGIAQGIGQALFEDTIYDKDGQLLSGSFMDYSMPRADNIPSISISMNEFPCKTNSLGVKGAGEAGTTGATGAVINALVNALSPFNIKSIEMPATPEKVWRAINEAKGI